MRLSPKRPTPASAGAPSDLSSGSFIFDETPPLEIYSCVTDFDRLLLWFSGSTTHYHYPTKMVQSTVDWDQLDKQRFYTIGPALNLCTRAFLYPTKLIKTRLQVQASSNAGPKYNGMVDALRKISESLLSYGSVCGRTAKYGVETYTTRVYIMYLNILTPSSSLYYPTPLQHSF